MSVLRQIVRVILFLAITIVIASIQAVAKHVMKRDPYYFARLWHRVGAWAFGMHTRAVGTPASGRVLFLANHVSYMDIAVFGGLTPVRFISKKEVKGWPLFGQLAGLQDTLFIDRSPTRAAITATRASIQDTLNEGARLIIFPEGTNTIGDKVLPFRRAAIGSLKAEGYVVQPVAIRAAQIDGKAPKTTEQYEVYGWGDMSFAGHLLQLIGHRRVDVDVHFLDPIALPDGIVSDEAIEEAGNRVREAVERANAAA